MRNDGMSASTLPDEMKAGEARRVELLLPRLVGCLELAGVGVGAAGGAGDERQDGFELLAGHVRLFDPRHSGTFYQPQLGAGAAAQSSVPAVPRK